MGSKIVVIAIVALVLASLMIDDVDAKKRTKRKATRNITEDGNVTITPWNPAVTLLSSDIWTESLVLDAENTWLVQFYSETCEHCQELRPVWEGLAESVQGLVKIGAVNCDVEVNGALCNIYSSQGLPSIIVYLPGVGEQKKPFIYRYERSPAGLIELVLGTVPRVARYLRTESEWETWFAAVPELPRCVHITNATVLDSRINALAYTAAKKIAIAQISSSNKELVSLFPSFNSEQEIFCYLPNVNVSQGVAYGKNISFPECANFLFAFASNAVFGGNLTSSEFYLQFDANDTQNLGYEEIEPARVRKEIEEAKTESLVQFCHKWMPNCEATKLVFSSVAKSFRIRSYWVDLDLPEGSILFDRFRFSRVPVTAIFPGGAALPILFDGVNDAKYISTWVRRVLDNQLKKVEL